MQKSKRSSADDKSSHRSADDKVSSRPIAHRSTHHPVEENNNYRLRTATIDDLLEIETIMLATAEKDELWNYIFPNRQKFADDHKLYWSQRLRPILFAANSLVLVAEQVQAHDATTVAWAKILIHTPKEQPMLRTKFGTLGDTAEKAALRETLLSQQTSSSTNRRRDVSATRNEAFMKMDKDHREYWDNNLPKRIEFGPLHVIPEHQKHGVGSMLLSAALEIADSAGLAVGTEATQASAEFYRENGFQVLKDSFVRAETDSDGDGVNILVLIRRSEVADVQ